MQCLCPACISRTGEDYLTVETVERPKLRKVFGEFTCCVIHFQSKILLVCIGCQIFKGFDVRIEIGVVDKRINILGMVNVDDIGTRLFCCCDFHRCVGSPAMVIPVAKFVLPVDNPEGGDQQFKIVVKCLFRIHLTVS